MIRSLLLALALSACASASIPVAMCTPQTGVLANGILIDRFCVQFDVTVPSGETYSRVLVLWQPHSLSTSANRDLWWMNNGKGWTTCTGALIGQPDTIAKAIVAQKGGVVIAIYTTWASAIQINQTLSAGTNTGVVVGPPLADGNTVWYPNNTACVDGGAGISVPFNIELRAPGGADTPEIASVTAQSGTNNNTWTIVTSGTHPNPSLAWVASTLHPVEVADAWSAAAWALANCGVNYGCNASRNHFYEVSSDTVYSGYLIRGPLNACLSSACPASMPGWYSSQFTPATSNTPVTTFSGGPMMCTGCTLDFTYINTYAATTNNPTQGPAAVLALLGCEPGVDTILGGASGAQTCTQYALAQSINSLNNPANYRGPLLQMTGVADNITPLCGWSAGVTTWNASTQTCGTGAPSMYQNGNPWVNFTTGSTIHGLDCFTSILGNCFLPAMDFLSGGSAPTGNQQ